MTSLIILSSIAVICTTIIVVVRELGEQRKAKKEVARHINNLFYALEEKK